MYQPKVSVIIFTYNQEDLISATIDSVLAQDYSNIEIVVADDASTDGTAAVIKKYELDHPGKVVGIYNKSNLGITGNSNVAFFASTGELIAVLGGDDLFLPGKISAQAALFVDPEVSISYHPIEIFQHQTDEVLFTTNSTKNEQISDVYDLIAKGGIPGASSVMVRRSACPEHGFDPAFPVVSDWIFSIEVAMNGKIKELPGIYGRYRKHGFGASDRSYELLDESLNALTVISNRYPDDEKLQKACQRGGYRYVLGELFRQVTKKNVQKITSLQPYLLRYSSGPKRLVSKALIRVLSSPMLLSVINGPLLAMKNFLKRNI
ncbi:glycosyltransferase [Pseudomonas fluorescens]|uniref:glycosyltransferase family 2 protein n=1 Tax=Pseudomonas fluorescens TaxID=294 RepID=UPI003524DA98